MSRVITLQSNFDEAQLAALENRALRLQSTFSKFGNNPGLGAFAKEVKDAQDVAGDLQKKIQELYGLIAEAPAGSPLAKQLNADLQNVKGSFEQLERLQRLLQQQQLQIKPITPDINFKGLESLEQKSLRLQSAFSQLGKSSSLGTFSTQAQAAQTQASSLQTKIQSLQRQISSAAPGSPALAKLTQDAKLAEVQLNRLDAQSRKLQQKNLNAGGNPLGSPIASAASNGISSLLSGGGIAGAASAGGPYALAAYALYKGGKEAINTGVEFADSQRALAGTLKEVGLSYDALLPKVKAYADLNGQSLKEGSTSFSYSARLASGAGQADKLDLFNKRFSDLAAGRGIKAEDRATRLKQIYSGEDEGTDALLGGNPSTFYDKYAAALGTTGGKLTDVQKKAALLNEIIKQGAIFDGEAEKRALSFAGSVDRITSSLSNAKDKGAKALGESVAPFLDLIYSLATGKSTAAFGNLVTKLPGGTDTSSGATEKLDALQAKSKLTNQDKTLDASLVNKFKSAEDLKNSFAAERFKNDDSLKVSDAGEGRYGESVYNAIDARRTQAFKEAEKDSEKYISDFKSGLDIAIKSKDTKLIEGRLKALSEQGGILGQEVSKKYFNELVEANSEARKADEAKAREFAAGVKESFNKIIEIRKAGIDVFRDLQSRANEENPFVKFALDGQKAFENLTESTRNLGTEAQRTAQKLLSQTQSVQFNKLALESNLKALGFNQEARRLGTPDGRQTGDQTRAFDSFSARFQNAESANQTSRDINYYRNLSGGVPLDLGEISGKLNDVTSKLKEYTDKGFTYQDRFTNDKFDALLNDQSNLQTGQQNKVDEIFAQVSELRRTSSDSPEAAAAIAGSVLDRIKTINPEVLANGNLSGTGALRNFAVEALKDVQTLKDDQTKRKLEEIEASRLTKQFAIEQLTQIKNSNISGNDKVLQSVGIRRSLAEQGDLTGQLKVDQFKDLQSAQRIELSYRDKTFQVANDQLTFTKQIDAKMAQLVQITQSQGKDGFNQAIEFRPDARPPIQRR